MSPAVAAGYAAHLRQGVSGIHGTALIKESLDGLRSSSALDGARGERRCACGNKFPLCMMTVLRVSRAGLMAEARSGSDVPLRSSRGQPVSW